MQFDLSDATAVLSRTPRVLHGLLAGLPSSWADAIEAPGTWSPTMVVAHLVSADRTNWVPRARIMLAEGPRALPFIDPDAQVRAMPSLDLDALLAEFAEVRAANLAEVASWNLGGAALDRTGEHADFGVVTLRQLLATWAAHDLSHVTQIARVMARQYREAVGPWGTYLRVMRS